MRKLSSEKLLLFFSLAKCNASQKNNFSVLFLSGFSFTNIHKSQDSRGNGEGISITPHHHFHPLHRHLDNSRVITAESPPLHIATSRTRTGNLWFPSASRFGAWAHPKVTHGQARISQLPLKLCSNRVT